MANYNDISLAKKRYFNRERLHQVAEEAKGIQLRLYYDIDGGGKGNTGNLNSGFDFSLSDFDNPSIAHAKVMNEYKKRIQNKRRRFSRKVKKSLGDGIQIRDVLVELSDKVFSETSMQKLAGSISNAMVDNPKDVENRLAELDILMLEIDTLLGEIGLELSQNKYSLTEDNIRGDYNFSINEKTLGNLDALVQKIKNNLQANDYTRAYDNITKMIKGYYNKIALLSSQVLPKEQEEINEMFGMPIHNSSSQANTLYNLRGLEIRAVNKAFSGRQGRKTSDKRMNTTLKRMDYMEALMNLTGSAENATILFDLTNSSFLGHRTPKIQEMPENRRLTHSNLLKYAIPMLMSGWALNDDRDDMVSISIVGDKVSVDFVGDKVRALVSDMDNYVKGGIRMTPLGKEGSTGGSIWWYPSTDKREGKINIKGYL